jgi:putative SOS response-associated peptidase YedK
VDESGRPRVERTRRTTLNVKRTQVGGGFDAPADALRCALARYDVAPRQQVAILERAEDGTLFRRTARWGLLPRWAKTSKDKLQPINARDDKLLGSKMWRPLVEKASHRVLIPADGWYEWIHTEKKTERPAPFRHLVDGGGWFAFAGLPNTTCVDDLDKPITTVTIVTTSANAPASRVHDRMPAVRTGPDEEAAWLPPDLGAEDALELVRPLADDRVELVPASKLVNSVKNQGVELLDVNSA